MQYPQPGEKTLAVQKMQLAIISRYGAARLPRYGADGGFGNETVQALKYLQQQEGLPVSGRVDAATWQTLFGGADAAADGVVSLEEALSWDTARLEAIAGRHIAWSRANNRVAGNPVVWQEAGCLNILGIRNNHEHAANRGQYNDLLLCWMPGVRKVFPATTDPATEADGRAHLRQGAWNSYVVRPHQWKRMHYAETGKTRNRWAFCQDKAEVEVLRTDGHGKVKTSERGQFGINIHDCYRTGADTSLGCTVLKSMEDYCRQFVPMFMSETDQHLLKNHNNLTYVLINANQLAAYL